MRRPRNIGGLLPVEQGRSEGSQLSPPHANSHPQRLPQAGELFTQPTRSAGTKNRILNKVPLSLLRLHVTIVCPCRGHPERFANHCDSRFLQRTDLGWVVG